MLGVLRYDLPTYCEQLYGTGYLNITTNLFFVLAAIAAWRLVAKTQVVHKLLVQILVILTLLIGSGSLYFHVAPSTFSILFDALPIYLFLALALALIYRQLSGKWSVAILVATSLIFYIIATFVFIPDDFANGSIRHIGVLGAAIITAVLAYMRFGKKSYFLMLAIAIYGIAIIMRSIDIALCNYFTVGTHFLWHSLNALAAYVLMRYVLSVDQSRSTKK